MVNIAIAGATADVAKEVVDVLCAAGKHNILLLSRKGGPNDESRRGVRWGKTDYQDVNSLTALLKGSHTLLSFIDAMSDPDNIAQKNMIDACIQAGVKRFAPSEWAVSDLSDFPWYSGKAALREHLGDINGKKKVLEYCLFCPGFFMNYYTYPHPSAKHLNFIELFVDFHRRRALLLDGENDDGRMSLTTIQDVAGVVGRAVEYEGEWPVMGGINGSELSIGELVSIGERIRGTFDIERLRIEDLRAGEVKSSWLPIAGHHNAPPEMWQHFMPKLVSAMLLATASGSMVVPGAWNALLPDYRFTQAEPFLAEAWQRKD